MNLTESAIKNDRVTVLVLLVVILGGIGAALGALVAAVYRGYAAKVKPEATQWGDKNNFHITEIDRLHDIFPDARFVHIVRELQTSIPELPLIGGGYSWLRQFLPHVAAANVNKGAKVPHPGNASFDDIALV